MKPDEYELDADGKPLRASTANWESSYDGFMGWGEDENGDCCEDCICDDECASEEEWGCVEWTGKRPYTATYNSNDIGLQAGGFQMFTDLNEVKSCTELRNWGFGNGVSSSTLHPHLIRKKNDVWNYSTRYEAPVPTELRDCYNGWRYTEDQGDDIIPPCEDFTSKPNLLYTGERVYTGEGCSFSNWNYLSVSVSLLFLGGTHTGFEPQQPTGYPYTSSTLPSTSPDELVLSVVYGAYVSKEKPACSRIEFDTDGITPVKTPPPDNYCLTDNWSMRHQVRYVPDQPFYKLRSCLTNPLAPA